MDGCFFSLIWKFGTLGICDGGVWRWGMCDVRCAMGDGASCQQNLVMIFHFFSFFDFFFFFYEAKMIDIFLSFSLQPLT